jgi:hypothetical protein
MSTSPQSSEFSIDALVPYWRNPRRIPEEAVNAVAQSISAYGFQQPIVVDVAHVIIVGHTRYAAARRLNLPTVPVIVADHLTPERVKELRVLDNRVGEFSSWSFDELMAELADLDHGLMSAYFPEVGGIEDIPPPTTDLPALPVNPWEEENSQGEFICPACFHSWTMKVTVEQIRTGRLTAPEVSA